MSSTLNLTASLKIFGNERMNFKLDQFVANTNSATFSLLQLLCSTKPESFGNYFDGKFIGPFNPKDYKPENFLVELNGIIDLLKFYSTLSLEYTETNRNNNPIVLLDYLKQFVHQYEKSNYQYLIFKYNYKNRNETKLFLKEQFQFDYYYLFIINKDNEISVGSLWYD